uniref:Uncharacterized protein n=1 Tax=Anguilla anguilla TaxID=7936 RepID=A0A0E9RGI7_ANGAN
MPAVPLATAISCQYILTFLISFPHNRHHTC